MNIPVETKPVLWGMVGGAIAAAVIGFTWGGWVTGSKAEAEAMQRANTAVVVALAPVCVAKFQGTADVAANLAELKKAEARQAELLKEYNNGEPERLLNRDDVLDDVTLYWLTNTATSAARLYWETAGQSVVLAAAQKTTEISLPVAITVFPEEVYRAPETWARRAYRNLIYFHEADKGGHFAAWEEPELFSAELRAAFRSLREAR